MAQLPIFGFYVIGYFSGYKDLATALLSGKYFSFYTNVINSVLWTANYVDCFNIMACDDFNTTVTYKQKSDYVLLQTGLNY